jgi:hypothetical protein
VLLVVGVLWLLLAWVLRLYERRRAETASLSADLVAGGLLFLLIVGFFWRTLSGDVYQPADGGDLVSFLFPTYRFAARELAQGSLPLWNPHLYGGAPFIGDIQAGFLYPPNLALFLLLPDFDYPWMQWLVIGHLYWAGLGMYVLARTLRFGERAVMRPAALFAGIAFALSDPLLIHLGNLNLIAVLSWLPWVLAAYHRSLRQRSIPWALATGLLFALANYAGHAQSSFYIGLALVVYTTGWMVVQARMVNREEASSPSTASWLWNGLLILLTSLGITLLLTAPILLPAIEMTRDTVRQEFTYQDTVSYSLSPSQLIGLLTPGFFGRGPALHWSLWQRVELPYAGVATLILAVAGFLLVGRNDRRHLWPWLGLGLFGLAVGLGIYAIVHGWLTLLAPGADLLRAPARAVVLWTLSVSVLSAVGLDRLADSGSSVDESGASTFASFLRIGGLLLAAIVLPLSFFSLLITQQDDTVFLRASVASLALVFAALFWLAAWGLIAARQADWVGGTAFCVGMIALIFFDLSATGVYTDIGPNDPTNGYNHPEIIAFLRSDPDRFRIDTRTDIAGLWQPDAAALSGLEDVGGVANPLMLKNWSDYWEALGGRESAHYDLLNVKYVIARDDVVLPGDKFELVLDAPGDLAVYRNTAVAPRAWLASPNGDLAALEPDASAKRVAIETLTPSKATLRAESALPTYLVMSEVWTPGWQAQVNGRPAEVVEANGLFRAVAIPAGASLIELRYAPAAWQWGLVLMATGLAMIAILLVAGWLTKPAKKPR